MGLYVNIGISLYRFLDKAPCCQDVRIGHVPLFIEQCRELRFIAEHVEAYTCYLSGTVQLGYDGLRRYFAPRVTFMKIRFFPAWLRYDFEKYPTL